MISYLGGGEGGVGGEVGVAQEVAGLLGATVVAGVGAGLALVFLLVQLDTSFYSVQGLRDIGLPVLGGISMQVRPRRRVRGSGAGFAAVFALLLVVFGGFATYPMWLQKVF